MIRGLCAVGLMAICLGVFPGKFIVAEENWPQFQGPRGDGHSDAVKLPVSWSETEHVTWKTDLHDRGWSSPVIWGNQLWMTTATKDGKENFAICVDKTTGKILHDFKLWDVEKPCTGHATNSYASPTPVIEAGRVWLSFGSAGFACLDTATAKVIWSRRDLPCEHWRGPGSSPILYGDLIILHYDGYDFQYVVALNKLTGETVWKVDRDVDYGTNDGDVKKAFSTPIIITVNGRDQLVSPTSKAALIYEPLTGKELWRVRYNEFSTAARPLFGNGLVYINSGFGKASLYAVKPDGTGDVTNSHIAWKVPKGIPSKPSQVLVGDLMFMMHDDGVATCLDAKTGEQVWQQRVGGKYSSSPLYAAGKIYFFSEDGTSRVIKAGREYELISENKLADGCMASPAVSGKALFVRTKSALYRLEN